MCEVRGDRSHPAWALYEKGAIRFALLRHLKAWERVANLHLRLHVSKAQATEALVIDAREPSSQPRLFVRGRRRRQRSPPLSRGGGKGVHAAERPGSPLRL